MQCNLCNHPTDEICNLQEVQVLKIQCAIVAVICAYLGGDLVRIRLSILVGSIVPLLSLLVWDDITLSISTDLDGFDILDMLNTE